MLYLVYLNVSAKINQPIWLVSFHSWTPTPVKECSFVWAVVPFDQKDLVSCRWLSSSAKRTCRTSSLPVWSRASSTTMLCSTKCLWWETLTLWWRDLRWRTSHLGPQVGHTEGRAGGEVRGLPNVKLARLYKLHNVSRLCNKSPHKWFTAPADGPIYPFKGCCRGQ